MSPVEVFHPQSSQQGASRAAVVLKRPEGVLDVPPAALVGSVEVAGDAAQWATLELTPSFVQLYVSYMRGEHDPKPAVLMEARGKPGDYIYVIDGRVRDPQGQVPFPDIIGWYRSDATGRPIAVSFEYNTEHAALGAGGFSSLLSEPNLRALVYG